MRDTIRRDVAYALCGLRRAPVFALIVMLTLGAGLGAATTIFSVVNGVLLRPLPYREPERLVMIGNDFGQGAQSLPAASATDYLDYGLRAGLLYGVSPGDPLTFTSVSLALTTVALAACSLPARRASRADPLNILRND